MQPAVQLLSTAKAGELFKDQKKKKKANKQINNQTHKSKQTPNTHTEATHT